MLASGHFKVLVRRGKTYLTEVKVKPRRIVVRDESCRPGERVMNSFVDGKRHAVLIIQGWAPSTAIRLRRTAERNEGWDGERAG